MFLPVNIASHSPFSKLCLTSPAWLFLTGRSFDPDNLTLSFVPRFNICSDSQYSSNKITWNTSEELCLLNFITYSSFNSPPFYTPIIIFFTSRFIILFPSHHLFPHSRLPSQYIFSNIFFTRNFLPTHRFPLPAAFTFLASEGTYGRVQLEAGPPRQGDKDGSGGERNIDGENSERGTGEVEMTTFRPQFFYTSQSQSQSQCTIPTK